MTRPALRGSRVLLTGGLGFIGSALTRRLVGLGARVRVLDSLLPQRRGMPGSLSGLEREIEILIEDTRNRDAVDAAVRECDLIYHLADRAEHSSRRSDWFDAVDTACLGTLNVLDAIRVWSPSARLVFASSHLVYKPGMSTPVSESSPTEPTTIFGVHKLAAEKYCGVYAANFGIDVVIARLAAVFGPGQRLSGAAPETAAYVLDRALNGEDAVLYSNHLLDLSFIDDVVEALIILGTSELPRAAAVNVGSGHGTTLLEVAEQSIGLIGRGSVTVAPEAERDSPFVADVSYLNSLGQLRRTPFATALSRTLDWYQGKGNARENSA